VRCRRCRDEAVIEVRRHNAAYCKDCFVHVFRGQVTKAIEQFDMVHPSDRILVAVSGGKDSLALWDVLLDLGYDATGLYLGLGIGEYSERSHTVAATFAAGRDATLLTVDLAGEYGYDIPTAGRRGSRSTCAVCGLSKRYVFNKAAADGAFDVVATGHNLDDEAATLLGNTLRWRTEYIARQSPVLPPQEAMVKKVKPLVRLSELETAAYAFLRGIDYVVEECPLVAGNTQLRYKDAMNRIESASPGTKTEFFLGYLERGMPLFRDEDRAETNACERCGQPTTGTFCAFCRARAQILGESLRSAAAGDTTARSTSDVDTQQVASELSDEVLPVELYEARAR
jgi:tRNA-5-methyluridine54 2-sulfurtransferase